MAVDVAVETVIGRPRGEVAAFAADPDNATRWYVNIRSVRWETPPPVSVGTRLAFEAQFLGRRIAYTYEVREHLPGTRFVMSTQQGPFPMETTYEWEDVDEGTRMSLRNRGVPGGFGRLAAPAVAVAMRRAMTADLRRLKQVLEG